MNPKSKNPWLSKTLWVNLLAIAALFIQWIFGFNLSADVQVAILSGINLWLRSATKEPIAWTENQGLTPSAESAANEAGSVLDFPAPRKDQP